MLTVGTLGILEARLPEAWVVVEGGPEVEIVAVLALEGTPFAPTFVATAVPWTGTIQEFEERAATRLHRALTDCRILDIGGWDPAAGDDDGGLWPETPTTESLRARSIDCLHRIDTGQLVSERDVLLISDGWAVQITTTCALADRDALDALFDPMTRSVRVRRAATAEGEPPKGPPASDPFASRVLGVPVESLTRWKGMTKPQDERVWVSRAAIGRLIEFSEGTFGRLFTPTHDHVLDELIALEFATEQGPNEVGRFVGEVVGRSPLRFQLSGRFGDRESRQQLFVWEDAVVVLSGPGAAQQLFGAPWGAPGPEHVDLEITSITEFTSCMLEWVGAAPSWKLPIRPPLIDPAVADARLADGATPPPDSADEVLRAVWQEPWFRWQLVAEREEHSYASFDYLTAGGLGVYRIGTVESDAGDAQTTLTMLPSGAARLLRQFEDVWQAGYYGRDVTVV